MDTESIVRRIIELKKISVELKQNTQDPKSNSNDLIQSILQMGKSINISQAARSEAGHQSSSKLDQSVRSQRNGEPVQAFFKFLIKGNKSQISHSRNATQTFVFSGKPVQQVMSIQQKIEQLKQSNEEMDEEILNLQERLKRLQEMQKQERQEEWKDGLPYFILSSPKLKLFYTRLTIAEQDYDKIDYSLYNANLSFEKLSFTQIPQTGLSSRPPKSFTLLLQDLKEVSYHMKKMNVQKSGSLSFSISQKTKEEEQDFLVVYLFKMQKIGTVSKPRSKSGKKSDFLKIKPEDKTKEDEDNFELVQTLFIKFDNEEQMKQWDLGIYINFKIIEDLNKGESFNSVNSSTIINEEIKRAQPEKSIVQFRDLMNSLIQRKAKAEQSQSPSEQTESKMQKSDVQSFALKKLYSNVQSIEDLAPSRRFDNSIKIRDQVDSPTHQKIQQDHQQQITKERSNTSQFGGMLLMMTQQIQQKINEQMKIKGEELKKIKQAEEQQQKRKQAERISTMKKMQFQLSVKRARQSLRKGYLLIKYAKSALNPYQKRVYLSDDGKKLCWVDIISPSQPKFIEIHNIASINQGVIGAGVEAHISLKKIHKKGCFVTIGINSKDRKTLDLSCIDQTLMEEFCKDLQLYRKSLRTFF